MFVFSILYQNIESDMTSLKLKNKILAKRKALEKKVFITY